MEGNDSFRCSTNSTKHSQRSTGKCCYKCNNGKWSTTPAPPDGGWGWVVLLAAFVSYMIADGWSYTFGLFYPVFIRQFQESHSKTAIIGAMIYGIPRLVSPVVCIAINCYGCRTVAICGGCMTAIAFLISSFATSIDYLVCAIGLFASMGFATIYITSVVMVTFYFERRRGLATGLSTTGSGLGAFIFPPIIEFCLSYYSWRGTLLLLSGISLHIVMAGALFRPPPVAKTIGDIDESCSCADEAENLPKMDSVQALGSFLNLASMHSLKLSPPQRPVQHPQLVSISTWSLASTACRPEHPQMSKANNLQDSPLSASQTEGWIYSGAAARNKKHGGDSPKSLSCPDLNSPNENTASNESSAFHHTPQPHANFMKTLFLRVTVLVRSTCDKSLFINPSFVVFCASSFIFYLVVVVPYVYLADHTHLIGYTDSDAAILLSIIGISRSLGQIVLGCLGDLPKVNSILLYSVSIVCTGLGTILIPVSTAYSMLCTSCGIFGFGVSCTYVLQMMCVIRMVGLDKATNAFGIFQLIPGVATLIGTPAAGLMFEASGGYDLCFYVSGSLIFLSGCLLLPLPFLIKCKQTSSARSPVDVVVEDAS